MRTRLETPRGRLLDLREERERLLCVWRGRTGRCRAVELNSFKNHQQHRTEHQFINCSTWTSTSALQFLSLEFESFRIQSVWYFLPTLTYPIHTNKNEVLRRVLFIDRSGVRCRGASSIPRLLRKGFDRLCASYGTTSICISSTKQSVLSFFIIKSSTHKYTK